MPVSPTLNPPTPEASSLVLMTLEDLKIALNIPASETDDDDAYTSALINASRAIINYTERDFGSDSVTETRNYQYDGCGVLDIDDATAVAAVVLSYPNSPDLTLDATQWYAQPQITARNPVFTYLVLQDYGRGSSPEMGFRQNIDVLYREGRWGSFAPPIVKVTGTYGWPVVPDDVLQALVWTVAAFKDNPSPWITTSESIENYSRSFSRAHTVEVAIPDRAKDILSFYQRVVV